MINDLIFAPLIDWPFLVGLGVAGLCGTLVSFWFGLSGWFLRGLGFLCILVLLSQPSFRQRQTQALNDIVLVVTDQSSSQTLDDRAGRVSTALAGLNEKLAQMPDVSVKTVTVSDAAQNQGTRIFDAIDKARGEIPARQLSSIFILSDGQVHDVPTMPDFSVPVHHLVTARPDEFDRNVEITQAPAYAILGEPVKMTFRVDDRGQVPIANEPVTVSILVAGQDRYEIQAVTGQDTTVELNLTHAGQTIFEFSVDQKPGEITTINNTATVSVNGIRDRLRVLLVSGQPHAGARVWRNLLKSDSSVDLVHFTILRPPEKQDGVPVSEMSLIAFPTRELFLDKIDDFDLIIFDRYKRRGILPNAYLDNIARYVENGGAVLIAAGPDFASAQSLARTPLDRILPGRASARVLRDAFVPELTDVGKKHPVTADLPAQGLWGPWERQLDMTINNGQILMQGNGDHPLLILDRVGQGRVALLASDHAWLWYRQYQGGGPNQELLRRLAHWLMREPDLEEETLSAEQLGDDLVVRRQTLGEVVDPVQVTSPNGAQYTIDLIPDGAGKFKGVVKSDEQGVFTLADKTMRAVVVKGALSPIEFDDPLASFDALAPVVRAANGGQDWSEKEFTIRSVRPGRVAAGRGWYGIARRGAFDTLEIRLTPLVPVWVAMIVLLTFVIGAWLREGRR